MKKLFTILCCIISLSAIAQTGPFYISFDASDTLYQHVIVIDTVNYHHNIWQVGKPNKTVFDSAYSYSNAIVTDTLNPYPANDTSAFMLKISGNVYDWWVGGISFYYQLDIDSGSFGRIDISTDNGSNWTNITSLPGPYWISDTPALNVSTTGWRFYKINHSFELCDTFLFRFTFISDSSISAKNGWIIDNISYNYMVESIPQLQNPNLITLYPNPSKGNIYIHTDKQPAKDPTIIIYDIRGREVYRTTKPPGNNLTIPIAIGILPDGTYTLKYSTEDEYCTKQFIITR